MLISIHISTVFIFKRGRKKTNKQIILNKKILILIAIISLFSGYVDSKMGKIFKMTDRSFQIIFCLLLLNILIDSHGTDAKIQKGKLPYGHLQVNCTKFIIKDNFGITQS